MLKFDTLIERIVKTLGADAVVTSAADMDPYLHEERGLYHGRAVAVVKPASTAEVATVVQLCSEAKVSLVPQGGNTGLVGGSIPSKNGREILLSTRRLNKILAIDPINYSITVEAGCLLADVQRAASRENCLFPLSLASEGSCSIGGNLATNAGGLNVLRYGMIRDLTLGLEVVLPDGNVWSGLRTVSKDNTGYSLKHLFVGSEGTLGIITAASLKLFPSYHEVQTVLCSLSKVEDAVALLLQARIVSANSVTTFELISRFAFDLVLRHIPNISDPFSSVWPWYVLIELSTVSHAVPLRTICETVLEQALSSNIICDAVIAKNLEQTAMLWRIRESLPEAQKREGGSIKHDISVPVSYIPDFLVRATAAVDTALPGVRVCTFGHVGDGNIHFNLSQPLTMDKETFLSQWFHLNQIIHDIVTTMNGSIAAEHGIGCLKREEMIRCKSPVELSLMRRIKQSIDPHNLMNPGKLL